MGETLGENAATEFEVVIRQELDLGDSLPELSYEVRFVETESCIYTTNLI